MLRTDLRKCLKPDCPRKVPVGTRYCCAPCSHAGRHGYEIDQHSSGCDARAAERGECDEADMLRLRQVDRPNPSRRTLAP
jgi:hypothetical protein